MYQGNLETISNRQDWTDQIVLTDDNGVAVPIAGASISIAVRDQKTKCPVLSGSTADGTVTFPGGGTDGVFKWLFPAAKVHTLCARTYDVGITITLNGVTSQLLIATIPVLDGILP